MVPAPARVPGAFMPKTPDDNSNAAVQKRLALTKVFKGSAPKQPASSPAPKGRPAKPR